MPNWELISFVKASDIRFNVLETLNERVQTPTELKQKFGVPISRVSSILKELSEFSKDFRNIVDELSSAKIILEESGRVVEEFKNKLEYDPSRLEEIELRLATISLLKKKYTPSVDSILEYREKYDLQKDP